MVLMHCLAADNKTKWNLYFENLFDLPASITIPGQVETFLAL